MKLKQNPLFRAYKYLIVVCIIFGFVSSANAKDIFVSRKGNNSNPGTKLQPVESIVLAKKMAIEIIESGIESDVTIWLDDGVYPISEPLIFKPFNIGTESIKLQFKANKNTNPVLSGGIQISGWKKNNKGFWETELPQNFEGSYDFRELFIDGKRAVRARFPNKDYLNVKKVGADRRTNFYFEKGDFPIPENLKDVELVLLHDWSISRIGIKAIDLNESKLTAVDSIGAKNPAFFNLDHWEPNPRYFLENAPEFLDADYEWVYLKSENKLLLKLPKNINPEKIQIVAPVSEGLIQMVGTDNQSVKNIQFDGIFFQFSKWELPEMGYCGIQACHFDPRPSTAGWNVVPAAVQTIWAENISFTNCTFKNLGGSGIWFNTGSRNCSVINSHLNDISGNGIMIGEGRDREVDGEKWWQLKPEQVALGNSIENCIITDCGTQFYGAVGLWCGLTAETVIKNNEIFNLPYSGISVGWMWSPVPTPCRENTIDGNHIHHILNILSDGGGIYMLGLQPGSKILNNHIHDVKINAGRAESNGMFLDEGTTDVIVADNLIYNIAKSPIRFHRATTNLVKNNYLFCANDNPPIRYNSTEERDIKKVENKVFKKGDVNYAFELRKAIRKWE